MRHTPVRFNRPQQPHRGILDDDTLGILVLLALALGWVVTYPIHRGWRWLRTGQ